MTEVGTASWRPTHAHLRACASGVVFVAAGVTFGRPDLLVLGLPFAIVALWSVAARPTSATATRSVLTHRTLREGEATTWTATVTPVPGADLVTVALARSRWWRLDPRSGVVCVAVPIRASTVPNDVKVAVGVCSTKWGRRDVGPGLVAVSSTWGAFRTGPVAVASLSLVTLPLPALFDNAAPVPISGGLVGLNRSSYRGEGTEFATIRPFALGDRVRRVHWPVSLRTGTLHVATTFTDRDTHVVLVVDASNDVGRSEGIGGAASSLDLTVRAAGAIAEHFLRRGDRVELRTFGPARSIRVKAAAGPAHLRRLLGGLALVEATGSGRSLSEPGRLGLSPGGLVIMLSPLLSRTALGQVVALARRRLNVLVVDTLPTDIVGFGGDANEALAWRIRLLERRRELRLLQAEGVPVVAWRGPGSADHVLRDLRRRTGGPRMARR